MVISTTKSGKENKDTSGKKEPSISVEECKTDANNAATLHASYKQFENSKTANDSNSKSLDNNNNNKSNKG